MKTKKDIMTISTGAYLHIAHGTVGGRRAVFVAPVSADPVEDFKGFLSLYYKASQFFLDMRGNITPKSYGYA